MILRSGKEYVPLVVKNKNKNKNKDINFNLRHKSHYEDKFSFYDCCLVFSMTLIGYVIIYTELYP